MEMLPFFKSVLEQETAPVVLCDTEHKIIYMNPVACERYSKYGGQALLGGDLMACHNERSREKIQQVLAWFREDTANNRVHTFYNEAQNRDVYMVALRHDDGSLIGYYEKHICRDRDMTPMYDMAR